MISQDRSQTDTELLESLQSDIHDQITWSVINKRYQKLLMGLSFSSIPNLSVMEREEAYIDTILTFREKILDQSFSIQSKDSILKYLTTIYKNKLRDRSKRKKQFFLSIEEVKPGEDLDLKLYDHLDRESRRKKFQKILLNLPKQCRKFLHLYLWEELEKKEIMETLQIKDGTYRNKKSTCLDRIKPFYE